jgi:rare lipoprotein A
MKLQLSHKLKPMVATLLLGFVGTASIVPCAHASRGAESAPTPQPDTSGRKRIGIASFYASQFFGRPMADGTPMDPDAPNAASRTLPLGTTARVTNIETGKSAVVKIQDRGPYAKGRLVDLSPRTARKIGLSARAGLAKVVVTPITVPLPGGRIKLGAAAYEPVVARY